MNDKEKQDRVKNFYNSFMCSWTYERLTLEEKQRLANLFEWVAKCGTLDAMRTSQQINMLCCATYHSFLEGLGYTDHNWRENNKQ